MWWLAVTMALALVVAAGVAISSTPTPTLPEPVTLEGPPPGDMTTPNGLVVVNPSVVDLNSLSRDPEESNDETDSDAGNGKTDDFGGTNHTGGSDDGDSPDLDHDD